MIVATRSRFDQFAQLVAVPRLRLESDRISSSALPFFSSRSSIRGLDIFIATYCLKVYDGIKG